MKKILMTVAFAALTIAGANAQNKVWSSRRT